jgi:hypothetical protein
LSAGLWIFLVGASPVQVCLYIVALAINIRNSSL